MDRARIDRLAAEYTARFLPVWSAEASPADPFGPITCIEDMTCQAMHDEGRPAKEIRAVLSRLSDLLADVSREWEHVVNEDAQKFCWRMACQAEQFPRARVNAFRRSPDRPAEHAHAVSGWITRNAYIREGEPVHQLVIFDADENVTEVHDCGDLWTLREHAAFIFNPSPSRRSRHVWANR